MHMHTVCELSTLINHPGRLTDEERSSERNREGKTELLFHILSFLYGINSYNNSVTLAKPNTNMKLGL